MTTAPATTEYPEYVQTKEFNSGVTVYASSKPADATRMTVDSEGAAHIMSLLTDLYSDPNMAVLREYVSNAIDAHNEAGQTRAIEVTMPSQFDPVFKVQDFGIGMSAETVRDIYSAYGKSTKRHNFGQIGAFGLGCKSALTLTQQFSLVTIKDGKKTVASIGRGDDGVGTVNIVSQSETTESNGTTVKIPIKDRHSFVSKAENFFIAMPAGRALVDGKEPKNRDSLGFGALPQKGAYYRLVDDYQDRAQNLYISMGGIAYPVDKFKLAGRTWTKSRFDSSQDNYQLLIDIPIASVDLTPSRESLRYTDRTVKFLSDLFQGSFSTLVQDMLNEVDTAPTRKEALEKVRQYVKKFRLLTRDEFTWQGKKIVFYITGVAHTEINLRARGADYVTSISPVGNVTIPDEVNTYLVEADSSEHSRLRSNFKSFVIQTTGQEGKADLLIFKKGEVPTEGWLTDNEFVSTVTSEDIFTAARAYRKANRTPYVRGPRGKAVEMEYDSQRLENGDLKREDIKISTASKKATYVIVRPGYGPQFYAGKDTSNPGYGYTAAAAATIYDQVAKNYPNVVYIFLPRTRKLEPLLARFTKAGLKKPLLFEDWAKGKFIEYVKTSPYTRRDYVEATSYKSYADGVNDRTINSFKKFFERKRHDILDANMTAYLDVNTSKHVPSSGFRHSLDQILQFARSLGHEREVKSYFEGLPLTVVPKLPDFKDFVGRNYPLIENALDNAYYNALHSKVVDHTVLYINAAFVAAGRKSY